MISRSIRTVVFLAMIWQVSGCSLITPASQKATLPLEWPPAPLSEKQISEVRACHIEDLARERYAETSKIGDLESAFQPRSGCDWAVLALAYAERAVNHHSLPEAGIRAFRQAVAINYGFAMATPLFYNYFGATSIVKSPPFAQQAITDVTIQYKWDGLGRPVNYVAKISQATASPTLKMTLESKGSSKTINIDSDLIQGLSSTFSNLLPITSPFTINPCTDNYPGWSVQITFQDGTLLDLTAASNFIPMGGPWETKIQGQNYVHFSMEFVSALDKIITSMGIPHERPAAWTCLGEEVFPQAFPLQTAVPTMSPTPGTPVDWWGLWIRQPACQPPCWQNITPGVTTKDQAVAILESMPDTTIRSNGEDGVDWRFGSTPNRGGWLYAENGIVSTVVLSTVDSELTLQNVIDAYGVPGYVVPEDCRYGMCDTVLVYPKIGLWLNVFIENKGWENDSIQIEVLPDTIINRAHFAKPGIEYFKDSYLSPVVEVPVLEWNGYGSYPSK